MFADRLLPALVPALIIGCASPKSTVDLPETRLRVTDEMGNPIAGVPVWYGVESEVYRPTPQRGAPNIDGRKGTRHILKVQAVTPVGGEVVLPRRSLRLAKNEWFHGERIVVNAELEDASSVVRIFRGDMEDACRKRNGLCPADGKVDAIDIASEVWLIPEERVQALRRSDRRYGVVRVLLVDWDRRRSLAPQEADPIFVTRVVGSDRRNPETFQVMLPRDQ